MGQGAPPLDPGLDGHPLGADRRRLDDGPVRPLDRGIAGVLQHVGLGHRGHGTGARLPGRELVDQLLQPAALVGHRLAPAHVVMQSQAPAEHGRLLLEIGRLPGDLPPAVGVGERFVVQRDQPRRLGRYRQQRRIVGRLAERVAGQPQGLERRALGQVLPRASRARATNSSKRPAPAAWRAMAARSSLPFARSADQGPLVEQAALPAEQLPLHLVAHERVTEAEPVVGRLDQQAGGDHRAQHGQQIVLVHVGGAREHLEARGRSADRGRLQHAPLRWGEAFELAAHRLLERPRQADGLEVARPRPRSRQAAARISSM